MPTATTCRWPAMHWWRPQKQAAATCPRSSLCGRLRCACGARRGAVGRRGVGLVLDRRLRPFGRFHQKVVRPRWRGSLPHWQEDEQFEIDNHVSHVGLPAPGGDAALRDMVSDLMSVPLDFSKPLWHMHVIDGYKEGSVVLARVHHSIADGIALVRVMLSLTDESPNPKPTRASTKQQPPAFRLPLDWLPAALGRGLAGGQDLIANPDRALDIARIGAQGAYRLGRIVLLPPDPPTPLQGQLGPPNPAPRSGPGPLDHLQAPAEALR